MKIVIKSFQQNLIAINMKYRTEPGNVNTTIATPYDTAEKI